MISLHGKHGRLGPLIRSARTEYVASAAQVARVTQAIALAPAPPVSRSWSGLRRFGYACACLLVLTIAGLRVSGPVRGHRAASALISAVEAAQTATSFHRSGMLAIAYPADGDQSQGAFTFEVWASPDGWRWDMYNADGTVQFRRGWDKAAQLEWYDDPAHHRAAVAPTTGEDPFGDQRQDAQFWSHLVDEQSVKDELAQAEQVTSRRESGPGGSTTVVALKGDSGMFPVAGAYEKEYYVDDATGWWTGTRTYAVSVSSRTLVQSDDVEYDAPISPSTFTFAPAARTDIYQLDHAGEVIPPWDDQQ